METSCVQRPCLAPKVQGCMILLLTLTVQLWTLAGCQLSSDPNPGASPTETLSEALTPLQTSFSTTEVTQTEAEFSATVGVFTAYSESVLLSSEVLSKSEVFERSFSPSGITPYSTSADLVLSQLEAQTSFLTDWEGVSGTAELSSVVSEDLSTSFIVQSTVFVDSLAASLRPNVTEESSLSSSFVHNVQPSIQPDSGAGTPSDGASVLNANSSSAFILVAPTQSAEDILLSSSAHLAIDSTLEAAEIVSTIPSQFSSVTEMLDINSTTQTAIVLNSVTGETTSPLFSSRTVVSTPDAVRGNASCANKEGGCGEYQGEEDAEEEKLRIKIIVGVACGAILLVVILGVFIGCVLRRRGKMSSGSKIDLSSYWDDSVTLSYINGHIDVPKDSADEMISLDNDSFLNSLDSMSFTNTWTSDTSKHTNF